MNPRVKAVSTKKDFKLELEFDNGEYKLFDVKPYIGKGIFRELQNQNNFKSVKVVNGSIRWNNEADFCPDTLYIESVALNQSESYL